MTISRIAIFQRLRLGLVIFLYYVIILSGCTKNPDQNLPVLEREPVIEPDYAGVTIPPNIAPLNFRINEDGASFRVIVTSLNGTKVSVKSKDAVIRFTNKEWKKMIDDSRGGKMAIEIYSENDKLESQKYKPFNIWVAPEPIDPYVCYRLLYPGYETWFQIRIIQRDLENFNESSIIENQLIDNNCVNCHTFNHNNPEEFLIHIRGSHGGTYFINGEKITRKDLKTQDMDFGAVYPAWHPEGRFVAFSSNNIIQTFHAIPSRNIEVIDLSSSIVLYDTKTNEMLHTGEEDSIKYMETYPEWSPDGKYLYYCRARQFVEGSDFRKIKYALVRKSFDQETRTFGKAEIIFDAPAIDKSVSFPKISPDGRKLVFTIHDYGNFSIWHKEADLYLLDLPDGKLTRMDLNSDETESYHSWSSNSRWLVFSSKRMDGLTARLYFAYIDELDQTGKPFVMPQKDPTMYDRMLKTFNRPEFVTGRIRSGPRNFARAASEPATKTNEAAADINSGISRSDHK